MSSDRERRNPFLKGVGPGNKLIDSPGNGGRGGQDVLYERLQARHRDPVLQTEANGCQVGLDSPD